MDNRLPILRLLVLVSLLLSLTGCFSSNPEDVKAFLKPDQAVVTADEYRFEPPDSVTVISSNIPEFQGTTRTIGHTQVIRPDGVVSFERVGELDVAGKTPGQVAKLLAEKMSKLYKLSEDYPIDVRVTNASKYYYILGQVVYPGAKVFSGRETTLSAIAKALPNTRAWEERIQVIRPTLAADAEPKIFEFNYERMISHGEMWGNVLLQEGDIIYVPPTILGQIGLTLEEILGPFFQSATAARTVNPDL